MFDDFKCKCKISCICNLIFLIFFSLTRNIILWSCTVLHTNRETKSNDPWYNFKKISIILTERTNRSSYSSKTFEVIFVFHNTLELPTVCILGIKLDFFY